MRGNGLTGGGFIVKNENELQRAILAREIGNSELIVFSCHFYPIVPFFFFNGSCVDSAFFLKNVKPHHCGRIKVFSGFLLIKRQ